MFVPPPLDAEEKISQSDREISAARSAPPEFQEAPRSFVCIPNDKTEETMPAENNRDSTQEISAVKEEMEGLAESTDKRVSTKTESSGERYNPEESLDEMPDLEKDSIDEETFQSEELDRCRSSEDKEVNLCTRISDRRTGSTTEKFDKTNDSAESSNVINTEAQRFSCDSLVKQNVWPSAQDVLSETLEIQEEIQQTDEILESKKLIFKDPNLSEIFQLRTELSRDLIDSHMACQQSLIPTATSSPKLRKGTLTKLAGGIGLEMALICVLIGIMSTIIWFWSSVSVRGTTASTAES